MRFKRYRDEEPRISIAPLVDIVFLLLIFFMVTSQFDIVSGVRIDLPKVTRHDASDEIQREVTLLIDKSAQIYLGREKINRNDLHERLLTLIQEKGLINLIIQADKDVNHGTVVEVMDMAKSAGVPAIIIAAQWKSDALL